MEKSKFIKYCEKEFPPELDLSIRLLSGPQIQEEIDQRNLMLNMMISPIFQKKPLDYKKIIIEFEEFKHENPNETILRNEIFYGCGIMIMHQSTIEMHKRNLKNLKDKEYKDDLRILNTFERLLSQIKLTADSENNRNEIYEKIVEIGISFYDTSAVYLYDLIQGYSKIRFGQKIVSGRSMKQKYADVNLLIAKYLIEKMSSIPSIGETGRGFDPRVTLNRNYKLACHKLLIFTNLFGIRLPKSLPSRITKMERLHIANKN